MAATARSMIPCRGFPDSQSKDPKELWTLNLGGCIESTPAVWHRMLYVGTRGGQIYGIGDPGANTPSPSPTA